MDKATTTEPTKETFVRSAPLWSAEQLEKMGLVLFTDKKAAAKLTDKERNAEIEAFIWVQHVDIDQDHIEACVEDGTWKEEVRRFKRDPRMLWGLGEVTPIMEEMGTMLKAIPK